MAKRLLLLASLALLVVGCSDKSDSLSSSATEPAPEAPAIDSSLKGVYAMEFETPSTPKKEDDLGEAFAKGFGSMLASTMELTFDGQGGFSMSMMGFPVDGKVILEGDKVRLEPETIMGMTEEELKKQAKDGQAKNVSMDEAKMSGTVEENGDVIRLKGEKGEPMVFRRKMEAVVEDKVSVNDRVFVGTWVGVEAIANKKPSTDEEKQEEQLIQTMLKTMRFEFRPDYTFKMRMMFEMEGNWKREGDELVLQPTKMMGLGGGESQNDPMRLKIDGDKLTLKGEKADEGTLVFAKN
jgi:hypothetical protein